MTNAIRHSRSPRIDVDLVMADGKLVITIRDYGQGFDVDKTMAKSITEKKLGL